MAPFFINGGEVGMYTVYVLHSSRYNKYTLGVQRIYLSVYGRIMSYRRGAGRCGIVRGNWYILSDIRTRV